MMPSITILHAHLQFKLAVASRKVTYYNAFGVRLASIKARHQTHGRTPAKILSSPLYRSRILQLSQGLVSKSVGKTSGHKMNVCDLVFALKLMVLAICVSLLG
jgi:hypothetical protein